MGGVVVGILLAAALITSFISGIFGMAGGLILMGVLTAMLPVSTAMIFHGAVQIFANGWRAFLIRQHISWSIIGRYLLGGIPAITLLVFVSWQPDKKMVFILLGCLAFIPWIPKTVFALDAQKPFQAEILGFVAQGLNTLAGVVGPVLDIFFVKTEMTRQQIVATKGATQVIAHGTKIFFWSLPLIASTSADQFPPWWLVVTAIPISMFGTWLGGKVLNLMTDVSFRDWTKWILTVVGTVYLLRGFGAI